MAIENNGGGRTVGGGPASRGTSAGSAGAGSYGTATGEPFAGDFSDVLSGQLQNLSQIGERVTGFIRERPATSILIALGAGFIIGRIMRD